MPTNRELALEAAVRFTDRNKFAIDTMLKNAEKIEGWLSRDLPERKPDESHPAAYSAAEREDN